MELVEEFKYLRSRVIGCVKGERESAGRVERLEKSGTGYLWQAATSKSDREGVQDSSETSYVENVKVCIGSDEDG